MNLGARLPPALKGRASRRLGGILAGGSAVDHEVFSNLALNSALRWRVPARKQALAFGSSTMELAERATLALAKALCPRSDGFVDVGANYGLFSITARAARPDHAFRIVSIEADPVLAARLSDNAKNNSLNLEVQAKAVGAEAGTATFFQNLTDDSSGSLTTHFAHKHKTHAIQIPVVPLWQVIDAAGLKSALIKIDVEGAGSAAWSGLVTRMQQVSFLLIEIIGPESDEKLVERIVHETGWNSYYIEDYCLRKTSFNDYRYVEPFYNWLFCRESPSELRQILPAAFDLQT